MFVLKETINVRGRLKIKKYDADGQLLEEHDFKNLVVYGGKKLIASRLFSDARSAISILSATGNGTSVTFTFSAQPVAPFYVGQTISVVGMTPSAYNVTSARVISSTTTSVVVDSNATGTATVFGTIVGLDNGVITQMAVGEASTTSNLADTALYLEKGRVNVFSTTTSFEDGDSSVVYIAQFPAGTGTSSNGTSLQEAGLFNAQGIMMCRSVFSPVSKQASESLEIFWTVTIA